MSDTQWPRFMVFQQEAAGQPFVHNGTVHAPDIEMAMQNARDVFVRRPEAAALWVVPVEMIYSMTREELSSSVIARSAERRASPEPASQAERGSGEREAISPKEVQTYCIFGKLGEALQPEQLGEVSVNSAPAALTAAIEKYKDRGVLRWYVFPAAAVSKSNPADAPPMFAPARDKTFKDQAEYPVVTMMRKIRAKGKLKDE